MKAFETKLEEYAEISVRVGVNLQPAQDLIITSSISMAPFTRLVVKKAYEVGARYVQVEWSDEAVTRSRFELAASEALDYFPSGLIKGIEEMVKNGAALLHITGDNPNLLQGIASERIARARKASSLANQALNEYIFTDLVPWCIVAVPSPEWAKTVFPNLDENQAMEQLWESIFVVMRLNEDNPVQAWQQHIGNIQRRAELLNRRHYHALHYTGPGTDLTIELPTEHQWISAYGTSKAGHGYVMNMPTEEVFTVPKRDGVHGVVRSTKPLSLSGQLIDSFSLTFENGKIVDVSSEQGEDALRELIKTDDGASYLGEVALVPHDSPISNLNLIFNNTLFDENASCHLAIGRAILLCVQNGNQLSTEELAALGANHSLIHIDFMMGSASMNIDGILMDGTREPLFRHGNWISSK